MEDDPALKDFACKCRRMANSEHDRRLKAMFLKMAEDYERRSGRGDHPPEEL